MAKSLTVTPELSILQDQEAVPGKVTITNGDRIKCPACKGTNLISRRGRRVRKGEQTHFKEQCRHCKRMVHYILDRRISDPGQEMAILTAKIPARAMARKGRQSRGQSRNSR